MHTALLILLGDGVALSASSAGLTVRRVTGRHEIDWRDVMPIEVFTRRSRQRNFRYLRVRAIAGAAERRLEIPTHILSVTDAELERWVVQARRLRGEARVLRPVASETPPRGTAAPRHKFGRKPDPQIR